MAAPTTTITATIARTNDTGFTTQEEPARWLTISRYANPTPNIPPKGTIVRIAVDARGFVSALEPIGEPAPTAPAEPRQEGQSAPAGRDVVIARLAILKAASAFCAARPDLKSADVLTVAASWEAWVQRG